MGGQWHLMSVREVLEILRSDASRGLDEKEVSERQARFGPNDLAKSPPDPLWRLFAGQFKDFLVLVLLAATVVSGFLGEYADAITIMVIVMINAFLGCVREYRAEKHLAALSRAAAPGARVVRNGRDQKIGASGLVPGDIIRLEEGDRVPADIRLIEAVGLEVDESALTGEPAPVRKGTGPVQGHVANPGDISNTAYLGTMVARGRGRGVVVATGMATEMGHIAVMTREAGRDPTPLQRRLSRLGRWLTALCAAICAVVAGLGVYRGEPLYQMFMTGVSLAVAAIPGGLPAMVTFSLAIGVQRMIKRKAIVRRLPAVETLGLATVICAGKTGVITRNRMAVRKVVAGNVEADIDGEGYDPRGEIKFTRGKGGSEFDLLLKAAALCNNSSLTRGEIKIGGLFRGLTPGGGAREWGIQGDPTEGALLVMAARGGVWRERLEQHEARLSEVPFDSDRKRMTVIYRDRGGELTAYTKGAPDILLELCTHRYLNGKVAPLAETDRREILATCSDMASRAMRVLAFACRKVAAEREDYAEEENNLTFIGICGMIDPPRPSAVSAVHTCRRGGIHVAMVTGDHPLTARAVAGEVGLLARGGRVITGKDLDRMPEEELVRQSGEVVVYAGVSPGHRLRIVRALKQSGHVVAMTGDGVNDTPAVKESDIGIAMGANGAGAAREAASVILADDDFSTIVAAIEEARGIYDNIRKLIRYLLSSSAGEVLVVFLAVLGGLPLPLLPIQILWIKLVAGGLPALALGFDPADREIMNRKPGQPGESVLGGGLLWRTLVSGFFIALVTLSVFSTAWFGSGNLELARTMAFNTLVFTRLFFVFTCRSDHQSILELGPFTNLRLAAAVLCSAALQLAVTYLPLLQPVFDTAPLNTVQWGLLLAVSALPAAGGTIIRQIQMKAGHKFTYIRV